MNKKHPAILAILGTVLMGGVARAAPVETVLFSFPGDANGGKPAGPLLADASGNFYGTTANGGVGDKGLVYRLSPPPTNGTSWSETVLYRFRRLPDGSTPVGQLVADANGVLYGVTARGGLQGAGTVFSLAPPRAAGSSWKETILHSFDLDTGKAPEGGLIKGADGALYGTAQSGGASGAGTVFKLARPGPGNTSWTATVLHSFGASASDGRLPGGELISDASGALYGTTFRGGLSDRGIVYKLTPPGSGGGAWDETVLHSFTGPSDGGNPSAGVIADRHGVLYGATSAAGPFGHGTVFRLSPPLQGGSNWRASIVNAFKGEGIEGFPSQRLLLDEAGALYGVSLDTLFKLTPPPPGKTIWARRILHVFGVAPDGDLPSSGLVADPAGTLFGVTLDGGSTNNGVAFQLQP